MSDNPCAVVERQAFRHFHLCGDPPPIVALILRSSSVLPFRVGPRLVPGSRHRLRDAARSPVMPDAFWGHGTGPNHQSTPPKAVAQAGQKDHRGFNTVGKSGECLTNGCGRPGLLGCELAFPLSKRCKFSPA